MLNIIFSINPQNNETQLLYNNILIGIADEEDILQNMLDDIDYNNFIEKDVNYFDYKKYAQKITELKTFRATK